MNVLDAVAIVKRPSHLAVFSHLRVPPCTQLLAVCTILLSGDVELNPGPPRRNYKYPCGACAGPVSSNQKAVCCDVCNKWLHIRCVGISVSAYSDLQNSPDTWACTNCLYEALPFQDTSSLPTPPSSPRRPSSCSRPLQIPTPDRNFFSMLYTNCGSLHPKLDELRSLVSLHTPTPSISAKPGLMIPFWTLNSISPTSLWFAGTETGTAVALLSTSMTPSLSRLSPLTPRSNWSFLNYLFGFVISPVPLSIAHRLPTHLFYTTSKTP